MGYYKSWHFLWGARMAQWWERSAPTMWPGFDSRIGRSYVGWVCCWFSSLLRGFFSGVLRFSSLLKNQHSKFQFDLMHLHFITSSKLLRVTLVNKLHLHFYILLISYRLKMGHDLLGCRAKIGLRYSINDFNLCLSKLLKNSRKCSFRAKYCLCGSR